MKYNTTFLVGQVRLLTTIKIDFLKEFQKPKLKSQCIKEIKETKQPVGELVGDCDTQFKILLDRLSLLIQDV